MKLIFFQTIKPKAPLWTIWGLKVSFWPVVDLKNESIKNCNPSASSNHLDHIWKGSHPIPAWLQPLLLWQLDVALQSRAEPLEGSANSALSRGLSRHKQARQFSPIDISHHAHTACISIHNLSGGGHWGEEESESEKEDNTVQEYSGALSLAGSFTSLSVLSLFSAAVIFWLKFLVFPRIQNIKCKRPLIVLNTEMGVEAWGLQKREKEDRQRQIQTEMEKMEMWSECSSTILARAGPTAQGLRKWLTLLRYHGMMCTRTCVYACVCGSLVWAGNL